MTTALLDAPTLLDLIPPDPHQKWSLVRRPGPTSLPDPGERRFSTHYMQEAMRWDPTFDGIRAEDQSDWGDRDIWCEEHWCQWAGVNA